MLCLCIGSCRLIAVVQLQVQIFWASAASPRKLSGCGGSEWIDPDTPATACEKADHRGQPLELVFSDEFDVDGRTFQDGHDSRWTAINGFPDGNEQINAYDDSPEFAQTADGMLKLKVSAQSTILNFTDWSRGQSRSSVTRPYTTPMLQSWNKFCFAGGRIELSAQLPGKATQPGIWPAFWLMGNLGRATVTASTENMWPYSYDHCPSADNSRANQYVEQQQMINKCRSKEWTDQYGLNPNQGRGAIEIDIIEAMPGTYTYDYKEEQVKSGHCPPLRDESQYVHLRVGQPMVATSLQLAPGILYKADQRPKDADAGYPRNCLPEDWTRQWYSELQPGNVNAATYGSAYNSSVNIDFWGDYFESELPWQTDSLSARHELPASTFASQNVYALEWQHGENGFMRFLLNDKLQYHINASTVERNVSVSLDGLPLGELLGRQIPVEPSYMMLNIDLSPRWGFPYCPPDRCDCCYDCRNPKCTRCMDGDYNYMGWLSDLCETLPAYYEIDWVRIYQRPGATDVGCSTKAFPSEGWIESHREKFTVPNMDEPLRPVLAGGAHCISGTGDCGFERGDCVNGTCRCRSGWTGPRCLATQVGASAICRPLESAAVGGATCIANAPDACGAQRGTGSCIWVWRPWERPTQELVLPNGSLQLAGGGNGRCKCASGWGGTHCNKPRQENTICAPDAALPSADLETLIDALCSQVSEVEAVVEICRSVQWKPHWQRGGELSTCGAWLRSSAVLQAVNQTLGICCSKLDPQSKQLQCAEGGGLPVSVEQCFLHADFGNAAAASGQCPWPRIVGLYAPEVVINDVTSQAWFPKDSPAEVAIVSSPIECQLFCQQSTNCSFFTYDGAAGTCWLKAAVNCSLDSSFTLSFKFVSGPRKGCIASDFVLNTSGVPRITFTTGTTSTTTALNLTEAVPMKPDVKDEASDRFSTLLHAGGAGAFIAATLITVLACYIYRRRRHLPDVVQGEPGTCVVAPTLLASREPASLRENVPDLERGRKASVCHPTIEHQIIGAAKEVECHKEPSSNPSSKAAAAASTIVGCTGAESSIVPSTPDVDAMPDTELQHAETELQHAGADLSIVPSTTDVDVMPDAELQHAQQSREVDEHGIISSSSAIPDDGLEETSKVAIMPVMGPDSSSVASTPDGEARLDTEVQGEQQAREVDERAIVTYLSRCHTKRSDRSHAGRSQSGNESFASCESIAGSIPAGCCK